uniref:Lectin, mannose binding 2 n=1 Tax=Molossus molossus TaxID=27622 RepID=A0A7J8I7I1_MOLMO|nr:lectin, mannose binding 2 [Molossus molossus]
MAAESWIRCWGWGRRCPARPGLPGPGPGPTTPLLILLLLGPVAADITDGNSEHLKREHSLIKPYQGVGSSSMPLWDFQGSTILTSQYVRLTPDERSKEGSIWNHQPCFLKDWEMHVHFKVHGAGKKNLHGDGIALWYTRDRLMPGPVFGSKDNFHGLAIFLDTYPNDETMERVFPYISVMVNNGSLSYDHSKDGRWTELAGCTADFRNRDHDTFLAVRYSRGRLTVMTDLEDKNEWKNCIDITGVRLPTGYYFGASAGTGDLSADQKMGKCPRVRINNNNNKNRAWQPFLHRASYANCTSGRSLHGTIRLCTGLPARTTLDSLPTLGSCPLSQPL